MAAILSSPRILAASMALMAGAVLCAPAHAASQYVVISAEGTKTGDFPPGKVFGVGDTIQLPEGALLTLLGEDGSVATIPGPAEVTVTEDEIAETGKSAEEVAAEQEKNRSTLSKLASILSGENRGSDSLGVSRGIGSDVKLVGLEDPWVVPAIRSAPGCVRNEAIRLGRTLDKLTISVSVQGDGADPAVLDWNAGEKVLALPEAIAPSSDKIEVRTGGRSVVIDLSLAPEGIDLEDPMAVMGWMVEQGCDAQALAFAKLLARDAQQ